MVKNKPLSRVVGFVAGHIPDTPAAARRLNLCALGGAVKPSIDEVFIAFVSQWGIAVDLKGWRRLNASFGAKGFKQEIALLRIKMKQYTPNNRGGTGGKSTCCIPLEGGWRNSAGAALGPAGILQKRVPAMDWSPDPIPYPVGNAILTGARVHGCAQLSISSFSLFKCQDNRHFQNTTVHVTAVVYNTRNDHFKQFWLLIQYTSRLYLRPMYYSILALACHYRFDYAPNTRKAMHSYGGDASRHSARQWTFSDPPRIRYRKVATHSGTVLKQQNY